MARIEFKPNPAAAANGIKFPGGGNVSASIQVLQDPSGNPLPIGVSTTSVNIGTGTITNNGTLTIKGLGTNIASFRNSSNIQVASIEDGGLGVFVSVLSQTNLVFGNGINNIISVGDGVARLANTATTGFNRLIFGTNDVSGVAFEKSGTNMRCVIGSGGTLTPFFASQFTSSNLSAGALTTASSFKVGSRAAITEAGLTALGLTVQIAIEHNGTVYYIPVSASQFA